MSKLLFLCQRIPYPPNKGEKIRAFHMLKHLIKTHEVHLGFFVDDPEDWAHIPTLENLCAGVYGEDLNSFSAKIRGGLNLLQGRSITEAFYRSASMQNWVDRVFSEFKPDKVVVFSSAMAQFIQPDRHAYTKYVLDFVDVDSDKWRQYAETKNGPMSWVYGREAKALLAYDRLCAKAATACTFVSEPEAELYKSLDKESAAKTYGLANGVDSDFFAPGSHDNPYGGDGPVFVFTGTMDYWPNVDAVKWFAADIFPKIRERASAAQFFIVGGKPSSDVMALAELENVTVTGRVEEIRGYVAHADVVVAPMRVARGVQNKVLEGMAMAKPVVTTPQGLEGIDATPGQDVLLCEDEQSFAEAALMALGGDVSRRLGDAARHLVVSKYSWDAALNSLDQWLEI